MNKQISGINSQEPEPDLSIPVHDRLLVLLDEWRSMLELKVQANEISPETAAVYRQGAVKFVNWLEKHGTEAPRPDIIREWKEYLGESSRKPGSVNVWLAGLRSFFGWLAEIGQMHFDPTLTLKSATWRGTKKKHIGEALIDKEITRLLAQPDRETYEGVRDYAILATVLYTVARIFELHRANVQDLKTIDGSLVLHVHGKGYMQRDDILVLLAEAESAVRDWLAKRGTQPGPLFVTNSDKSKNRRLSRRALREIVKKYFDAAGIHGNKTTQSLRRSTLTSVTSTPPK
jgi:integrase/recombinase XerD